MYEYGSADPGPFDNTMAFSDVSIRAGFIRKVYSILLCQLVVTIAFISFFLYCEPVREYAAHHVGLFYGALAVTFVTMIAMACCEGVRRKFPTNLIFLSIFTLCEGYLLGAVSSVYDKEEVLMAVGITAVVVLAITIFAFQTKYDFTMMGGILFVALIILICFGFLMIFFHNRVLSVVYACLGALIFAAYLVYDTQIMMGGGKMYSISPEEYIFAALNLYLDIVNLFLYILQIIAAARGD
ncbi:protein lifeguard 1-like [Montipora capricornis]|uniref:protein lifeguard 1-like n=1 Tax=Montipora foliosa TaxID=591990 RepID=UPI0035F15E9C